MVYIINYFKTILRFLNIAFEGKYPIPFFDPELSFRVWGVGI